MGTYDADAFGLQCGDHRSSLDTGHDGCVVGMRDMAAHSQRLKMARVLEGLIASNRDILPPANEPRQFAQPGDSQGALYVGK